METGLPGMALACAFLGWLVLRLRGVWRATPRGRMAALVVVVLRAHGFVDYPLRTVALSCAFAACLGMLSPRAAAQAPRVPSGPVSLLHQAGVGGMALVLVMMVLATGWWRAALVIDSPELVLDMPLSIATGITARPMGLEAAKLAQGNVRFGLVAKAATLAVAGSPLNAPAFVAAGVASPNPAQSAALLAQAHSLSRRDPALLEALFARAKAAGDANGEVSAADELLRLQAAPPALTLAFAHDLAKRGARSGGAGHRAAKPVARAPV